MSDPTGGSPSTASNSASQSGSDSGPDFGTTGASLAAPAAGPLSIGSVFGQSFSMLFGSLGKYIVVTAILWIPSVLFSIYFLGAAGSVSDQGLEIGTKGPMAFVFMAVMAVAGTVMYGAIIHITCLRLAGRPASIGGAIGKGFARFFPLFVAYITVTVLTTVGLLLVILPGLWVVTIFALAIPVTVAENKGPFASMGRSAELTKGYRWKVLGSVLLLFALIIGLSFAMQFVVSIATLAGGAASLGTMVVVAITFTSLAQMAIYLYMLIFFTVLYHQIRIAKEGSSAEEIAAVFD